MTLNWGCLGREHANCRTTQKLVWTHANCITIIVIKRMSLRYFLISGCEEKLKSVYVYTGEWMTEPTGQNVNNERGWVRLNMEVHCTILTIFCTFEMISKSKVNLKTTQFNLVHKGHAVPRPRVPCLCCKDLATKSPG